MTYPEEAMGIVDVAKEAGIPVAIAFAVETDGRLPCGKTVQEAITEVDRETDNGPVYYMINCAHPSHFQHVLNESGAWKSRIQVVRANASCRSHAELDEANELYDGNPIEFDDEYQQLAQVLPRLNLVGGCCGTDHRHVDRACHSIIHPSKAA